MRRRDEQQRQATHLVCRHCGQLLSVSHFERYKTGTYRRVCHHCWWELYGRRMRQQYILRQVEQRQKEI